MFLDALARITFFATAIVALGSDAGWAESAEPLLTVVDADDGVIVTYDRAALEAMPQTTYLTSTIWTEGVRELSGVPLIEVLTRSGVEGRMLLLTASNDYSAEIPMAEVTQEAPIIAMKMDGVPMSLRDKGPLWLVYPYDSAGKYQTEVVYTRSVWQLIRIEVID